MIPLRDTAPQRRVPFATVLVIALCTASFALELQAGAGIQAMIDRWGLTPQRLLTLGQGIGWLAPEVWLPLLSSTFLHGDALHFGSNMLFLWIFGGHVEDRTGHLGFPLFYLAGGAVAGLAHVVANPASIVPTIGASGAIAAVMGAYFLLFPRAWIVSMVPPFFWVTFRMPALLYLAMWFALQVYMAQSVDPSSAGGNVAWWAHAGGFAFGAATILWIGPRGGALE